jgi:hypothetical protein
MLPYSVAGCFRKGFFMRYTIALLCVLMQASWVSAQEYYAPPLLFDIAAGYSHLYIDSPPSQPINKDGAFVDFDLSVRVPSINFPLLLGGGASVSGYWRRERDDFVDSSGFGFRDRLDSDMGLYSLEARAAIPLRFGRNRGFFLTPRIVAGLVVDDYAIDHAQDTGNGTFFFTDYHTGAAFGIHPAVEAGYFWYHWAVGAQVSYLAAWGDFGQLGSTAQEIRGGVFVRWSQ